MRWQIHGLISVVLVLGTSGLVSSNTARAQSCNIPSSVSGVKFVRDMGSVSGGGCNAPYASCTTPYATLSAMESAMISKLQSYYSALNPSCSTAVSFTGLDSFLGEATQDFLVTYSGCSAQGLGPEEYYGSTYACTTPGYQQPGYSISYQTCPLTNPEMVQCEG